MRKRESGSRLFKLLRMLPLQVTMSARVSNNDLVSFYYELTVQVLTFSTFTPAAIGKAQAIIPEDVLDEKEKARVGHDSDSLKSVKVPVDALEEQQARNGPESAGNGIAPVGEEDAVSRETGKPLHDDLVLPWTIAYFMVSGLCVLAFCREVWEDVGSMRNRLTHDSKSSGFPIYNFFNRLTLASLQDRA